MKVMKAFYELSPEDRDMYFNGSEANYNAYVNDCTEELELRVKPCPFCDATVILQGGGAHVLHPLNDCIISGYTFSIIGWNRRES